MKIDLGYTNTYPGNLEDDPTQKNYGVFFKNAFQNMFSYIGPDEIFDENGKSKILQLRSRHMIRSDIGVAIKKLSFGTSVLYNSYTERFPSTAIGLFSFTAGPNGLPNYNEAHQNGDWVINSRIGYKINNNVNVKLFVKNLLNREYWTRPGKIEPPRTLGLQLIWQN